MLVAFTFGAFAAPQYIEALTVGTLGATTFTGLVIGTDVQAWDTDLDALAGVTGAANAIPYFTAVHTCGVISSSANMISLLGSATYAAAAQNLSLEIGVDTQAYDSDLDTWATLTPTANAQTLVESTNFASMAQDLSLEIGVDTQAYDADLTAIAALTSAANTLIYYTGAGTAGALTSSANMISLLGSATYAAAATALSLEIGVDTQAYDADLDTYATITPTASVQIALANAADQVVLNHRERVTIAEIIAGHELLPAIAGRSYRLIECLAIAYGGAAGTVTTVDLIGNQAGVVKLVEFAQASLTQSSVLVSGGTGAAVQADAASYTACTANTAITVGQTGSDIDTSTGVDFILTYVIE